MSPDQPPLKRQNLPVRIFRFYLEGFRSMTIGRYLWALILAKLFILFFVFKLLFFPDLLKRDYDNDADRAAAVRRALVDRSANASYTGNISITYNTLF
ncbi:MAG: DUF4492 domain-containing protein [Paramuribaculum sp.]|nr:DUF4492 domain-containing protein [Paramuribaculum sp.]